MEQSIVRLARQLTRKEKKELVRHIKNKYAIEEGEGMIRDDIKDKVIELMHIEFGSIEKIEEKDYFKDMDLNAIDVVAFADVVVKSFGFEDIQFSNIMQWQTVKDIVDYVEDNLSYICEDYKEQE